MVGSLDLFRDQVIRVSNNKVDSKKMMGTCILYKEGGPLKKLVFSYYPDFDVRETKNFNIE
jgi:hypothetical protein